MRRRRTLRRRKIVVESKLIDTTKDDVYWLGFPYPILTVNVEFEPTSMFIKMQDVVDGINASGWILKPETMANITKVIYKQLCKACNVPLEMMGKR